MTNSGIAETGNNFMKVACSIWIILAGMLGAAIPARAQGTAVELTHGQLSDGGQPAGGTYDLTFTLYDSAINGTSWAVFGPMPPPR